MPTPRLTKSQKTDIALAWLRPLQLGERPVPHDQLAREFAADNGRPLSAKAVAEAIRYAFSEGLVSLRRNEIPPNHHRRSDLEAKLLLKYRKVKRAIVVESEGNPSEDE